MPSEESTLGPAGDLSLARTEADCEAPTGVETPQSVLIDGMLPCGMYEDEWEELVQATSPTAAAVITSASAQMSDPDRM